MGRDGPAPGALLTVAPPSRVLALAVLDFLDQRPHEMVRIAADTGFTAVSLRVSGSRAPVPADVSREPGGAAGVRRALDDVGLGVLDVEVVRMGPGLSVDEVRRAVDLGHVLEARHLLVVDADHGSVGPAAEQLAVIDEIARMAGMRPCLEFMAFSGCRTLDQALAVVTASGSGAGVLVDTLHLYRGAAGGLGAAALAVALRRHGPERFPYLQLCDAPRTPPSGDLEAWRDEALGGRLLPGAGELALAEVLALFPDDTPVAVEAPGAGAGLPAEDRARAARLALGSLT